LLTLLTATLSQLLSNTSLRVPNPPAFLVLSIVFSAFQGGLASGLISAIVAWAYVTLFFSNPGQPFVYTDENLRRVIVWAITMPAMAALVGVLQRRAERALAMAQSHTALQAESAERQRAEAALRESEAMFQALFEFAPDAIVVINCAGNIVRVNAQTETMFGYRREALHGQPVERLLPERFREAHLRHRARYCANPSTRPMGLDLDLFGRRQDGSEFPVDIVLSASNARGELLVTSTIRDITERKQAEERMRASLKDKEVLLREIYHRVKNNLQVISSLLNLQAGHVRDERDAEMFRESRNRVRSISLVHERLYRSKNLAHIDGDEYIRDLLDGLFQFYGIDGRRVTAKIEVGNVSLPLDTAIPLGLILNELLSNCLKHAFPGDGNGEIRIMLRRLAENGYELLVGDDGVGLPPGLDLQRAETLGFQLVDTLVKQLEGEIETRAGPGAEFRVRFKEVRYRPRS
jgi:PAS domain S-box-containing protein